MTQRYNVTVFMSDPRLAPVILTDVVDFEHDGHLAGFDYWEGEEQHTRAFAVHAITGFEVVPQSDGVH